MPVTSGGTQWGKYELLERLGRGGMGEVWKARLGGAAGFSRTLVVKRLLPHLLEDERFVDMFLTEARLSAQLLHPNIVQIFELGEIEGEFYLAMEYVNGRDLGRVINQFALQGQPPPVPLAAYAIREICRALAYAHQLTDKHGARLGLIHRDVSPSNVMLSLTGAVKLLDFGVAKAAAESQNQATQTGVLKGKLWYMAPERVDGKSFDHRSDIFSTGVVLYEALTATRLFEAKNPARVINLICSMPIAPPSSLNPEIPVELDRICLRALARNPDERYTSAEQMAQELDELLFKMRWGAEQLARLLQDTFSLETHVEPGVLEPERVSPSGVTLLAKGRTPASLPGALEVQSHEVTAPSSRRTTAPDVKAIAAAAADGATTRAVPIPERVAATESHPILTTEDELLPRMSELLPRKSTPLPPLREADAALIRDEALFSDATHILPQAPPPPLSPSVPPGALPEPLRPSGQVTQLRLPRLRLHQRWWVGGLSAALVFVLVLVLSQLRDRSRADLVVTSDPPGALATVSGSAELSGLTPLSARLPRGERYLVHVAQPGFEPYSETIVMDKDVRLKVVLKPLPLR
jgi:serine/threonine protein kinase